MNFNSHSEREICNTDHAFICWDMLPGQLCFSEDIKQMLFSFKCGFVFSDFYFENDLEIKSLNKKNLDRTKSRAMESTQVLAQPVHHRWCNCWGCRQSCCNAVISVQKVTPCRETHSDWTYYSRLCPALISFSPQEIQPRGVTFVAPSTRSLVTEQHGTRDHRNLYESCWQAGELVIPESSFHYAERRLPFYCTCNQ